MLLVALALLVPSPDRGRLELARDGRASVVVRLTENALPSEATAARELVDYLALVTSAPFELIREGEEAPSGPTIEVGPTRLAGERDPRIGELDRESWVIRVEREHLLLYGGRPRGTLYAVYRFLEDHVGVRWWTPYEESVPARSVLSVGIGESRGSPAFVYRDVHGVDGPRRFNARNRLNGHTSRLTRDHGGAESYGPPSPVHNFFQYVPPSEFFESHPEYFSEVAGLRDGGRSQLCLTNAGLVELVRSKLEGYIEQSRRDAKQRGEPPPQLFNFSPMDWQRACTCEPCSALAAREGGQSGPLIAFVNRLAEAIGERHPDVLIDTLAYLHTFDPPRAIRAADNVTVRVSALQYRDFAKPVTHPDNRRYQEVLRGWRDKVSHLRVWDYPVIFGEQGELPLPNLPVLAADFRFYCDLGVEGIFIENPYPIAGDMRDLKLWVMAKLLEDPGRELAELVREFTGGYFGAAGHEVRAYLSLLEAAAASSPSVIPYRAGPEAYRHLDRAFIVEAQRLFDVAETRVANNPTLLRRLFHARLTLDRATLLRWPELVAEDPLPFERADVVRRYRLTWREQIELRMPESSWPAAMQEVEREISWWNDRLTTGLD